MNYIITTEQLIMFIKKFYGPLERVSSNGGRYVVWYNQNGEKIFELIGERDMSIKSEYYYLLLDFISPSNASERSPIVKGLHKYLKELSGKENLYITTM